jgi:hemerythrin-like domain-containing protein
MPQPIRLQSLVAQAASGFDEPFEMLEACHERIERMLRLLARLRAHLPAHGAGAQAQQAARDILRYFDQAAPLHHQDEELHVFPPLLAGGDAHVAGIVQRLQQDHRAMEARWQDARAVLLRVADGSLPALAPADATALDAFAGLYEAHLRAEHEIAYPAAQALLDAPTLQAMGEDMARRRGVK